MKRFMLEMSDKLQNFLDEDGECDFVCISSAVGATLRITYKGAHAQRPADEVDVENFVGVKSRKAKGKRLTTYDVDTLTFIEPIVDEPEEPGEPDEVEEPLDVPEGDEVVEAAEQVVLEDAEQIPEQLNLFGL